MFVILYGCEVRSLPLRKSSTETKSDISCVLACVVASRDIN